jgi:methionine-rich copper-binding protein CopC
MKTSPALVLCAAFACVGPAFGHAKLLSTSPAANAQVSAPPAALTLTFNESVQMGVLRLTSAGHVIPVTVDGKAVPAKTVTIALPALAAGTYEVEWSALTPSDGHVVKGRYSFVIR